MSDPLRYIHFRGSDTVLPVVQATVAGFETEHPALGCVIIAGGTDRGYKAVIDGTAHVGMVSSQMGSEMERWARRHGAPPVQTVIGYDGIVAFVHHDNPVESLPLASLREIYTGEIINWKEVGGLDAPIEVLGQDPSAGTYVAWKNLVVGDGTLVSPRTRVLDGKSLFARLAETPAAIGYGTALRVNAGLKPVKINGFDASVENVRSGAYPVRRPLMLATVAAPAPEVRDFLAWFLQPDKGQRLIQSAGVVPAK